jgi:hypothetical protein
MRKQSKLVSILQEIPRLPLAIDWDEIVANQVACLCNGINNLGIPDLIIAQNAIQNDASLYTLDKHFRLMAKHLPLAEQSLPPYGEPASRQLLTHLPRHGFPYGSPPVKRDVYAPVAPRVPVRFAAGEAGRSVFQARGRLITPSYTCTLSYK